MIYHMLGTSGGDLLIILTAGIVNVTGAKYKYFYIMIHLIITLGLVSPLSTQITFFFILTTGTFGGSNILKGTFNFLQSFILKNYSPVGNTSSVLC